MSNQNLRRLSGELNMNTESPKNMKKQFDEAYKWNQKPDSNLMLR